MTAVGLLVARAPEPVELALAVVVEDHGQPAAVRRSERELRPDPGQARFSELAGHRPSFDQCRRRGKSRRPMRFDSFMSMTPIVAVART